MPNDMPPAEGQGAQKGGFSDIVSQVFQGLGLVSDVIDKANAPAPVRAAAAKIQDDFQKLIQMLSGAPDEGQGMTPKPPATSDAMAGASGNAAPVMQ
jgi:hypothetical protein